MNNKIYTAIIIVAVIISLSTTLLFVAFRDRLMGTYTPEYENGTIYDDPGPTHNNGNNETATPYEEETHTPTPEETPYPTYETAPEPEQTPAPTPIPLLTDRISWHIYPTWDFDQVFNFQGGMAGIEFFEDGHWESMHILGYMNAYGEIVIPIEHRHYPAMYAYRGAPPFSEGLVAIHSNDHSAVGVFDTMGNLVIPFYYTGGWMFTEGLMAVTSGGDWEQTPDGDWVDTSRWGFIDHTGTLVIPMEFEEAGSFSEGLAPVMQGGYWGFINTLGEVVIPFTIRPAYTEGHGLLIVPRFSEGLVAVSTGGVEQNEAGNWIDNTRWGFLDTEGNQAIPFMFTQAESFSNGLATVRVGGWGYGEDAIRWGAVDREGNVVVPFDFEWLSPFREYAATGWFANDDGGFQVIIDTCGNQIAPPGQFREMRNFSEGYAPVTDGYNWETRSWGFIDSQGNIAIPLIFRSVGDFSQGFAPATVGGWETTPDGRAVDNSRSGFIDTQGNIVVPLEFNEVRMFSEGFAWVRQGDLWGLLRIDE